MTFKFIIKMGFQFFFLCTSSKPAQLSPESPSAYPLHSPFPASDSARFTRNGTNDFVCDNLQPQTENLHHKLKPRLNFVSLLAHKPGSLSPRLLAVLIYPHISTDVWECVATKVFAMRFRITVLNPFLSRRKRPGWECSFSKFWGKVFLRSNCKGIR